MPPSYSLGPTGWPLIKSLRTIEYPHGSRSGYKNVTFIHHRHRKRPPINPWQAKDDRMLSLGMYRTKEAAAEAYSRYLGMEAACRMAQAVEDSLRAAPVVAMSEEEAFRVAASEGLTLRRSAKYASGFDGVIMPGNVLKPFCAYAYIPGEEKRRSLGTYVTAAEAALVIARERKKVEQRMM